MRAHHRMKFPARPADAGDLINAPFFDIEDDYFVKAIFGRQRRSR